MFQLSILLICVGLVRSAEDKNIVDGRWRVLDIAACSDGNQYPIKFNVMRRKCDRTTDCFFGSMDLERPIDDAFGIRCDTCKSVEGGCKPYQELRDPNFIQFCKKYADSNVKKALEMMNVNPPDFPITKGSYTLENYMFEYCDLPKSGPEGSYTAVCYLTEGNVDVSCLQLDLIFTEELDECE